MSCRLVIIDDHGVFRDGLRLLLERHAGLHVVGEAAAFPEAFDELDRTRPDVVLLDVRLSNGADGVAVAREILRRDPRAKILMLTMVDEPERAAEAFAAGALGYATKDQSCDELAGAIRAVGEGKRYLSSTLSRAEVEAAQKAPAEGDPLASLTSREREVFELLLRAETSNQIAERLSISVRTVESHRARILQKLGVRTTIELVRLGAKSGLLGHQRDTG